MPYKHTGSWAPFHLTESSTPGDRVTVSVSYAAIECGCPQWFETKFKDVPYLKEVERFYLEPTNKELLNANKLWDGEHIDFTLNLAGRFSKEKESPVTYNVKGPIEKARIFWCDEIRISLGKL